jgi:hypothetical protein
LSRSTAPRVQLVAAATDARWATQAALALEGFVLERVALGEPLSDDPVVLVWSAGAARAELSPLPARRIVLWRTDATPVPDALADATPVGPELGARGLRLVTAFVVAEAARHAGTSRAAPRRRRHGPALAGALTVLLVVGGVLFLVDRPSPRAAAAAPLEGLRGRN